MLGHILQRELDRLANIGHRLIDTFALAVAPGQRRARYRVPSTLFRRKYDDKLTRLSAHLASLFVRIASHKLILPVDAAANKPLGPLRDSLSCVGILRLARNVTLTVFASAESGGFGGLYDAGA